MGIDRPDVEAVVHFEIPGSLEAYYQEIGRGGRDGRRADATLLWNYVDVRTRDFLIAHTEGSEDRRDLDRRKLTRMIAYADSSGCYRATILGYFGERGAPWSAVLRQLRAAPRRVARGPLRLRKILSGVARGGERWGKRKLVAMLTGDCDGLPEPLTRLSTTGILSADSPRTVGDWIDAAQGGGLLSATDDVYRTLSLTPEGREVMAGRTPTVALTLPEPPRPKAKRQRKTSSKILAAIEAAAAGEAPEAANASPADIDALREWRRREAARRSLPAYVVLHDRTLAALAAFRPSTLEALSAIPGIGPAKLRPTGRELLQPARRRGLVSRDRAGAWSTSSGQGRMCPGCGWPEADCHCAQTLREGQEAVPARVVAKLRLENRASGKHVTVVDGLPDNRAYLDGSRRELSGRRGGTGGATEQGAIVLQGDQRERLRELLEKKGLGVKG
jgi:ATP-dependent DNA helicase RecQ